MVSTFIGIDTITKTIGLYDSDNSNIMKIINNNNMSANRNLNINMNDADRNISLSGNLTIPSTTTCSGTNTGDQMNFRQRAFLAGDFNLSISTTFQDVTDLTLTGDIGSATYMISYSIEGTMTTDGDNTSLTYAEVRIFDSTNSSEVPNSTRGFSSSDTAVIGSNITTLGTTSFFDVITVPSQATYTIQCRMNTVSNVVTLFLNADSVFNLIKII